MSHADPASSREAPTPDAGRDTANGTRRRLRSRWWLAGLLVGCLLPAGLAQGDVRLVSRVVQICWLVPDSIRAESRRLARRRRWLPMARRREVVQRQAGCPLPPPRLLPRVAGVDVLSRRGPPDMFAHST
ncbi:hypothetical protein SAMN05192555_107215 [Franzmannia pantelleriensis]|uniref:Uncharacterized protein n=1 Tax=Franzmannia pantelleriensis TaxID=48727 RepID=A0A1G9NQL9_9GAMM|nr:hypothetical protein [Halomonas pantelleriensis]SDL88295.1 hypothetical protein SAMN05192555_107215 [Halomonas pantelleriensis]